MLIQRASDKSAAVRARAITNLASIIEHWGAQKSGPLAASIGQFRQVPDSINHMLAKLLMLHPTLHLVHAQQFDHPQVDVFDM